MTNRKTRFLAAAMLGLAILSAGCAHSSHGVRTTTLTVGAPMTITYEDRTEINDAGEQRYEATDGFTGVWDAIFGDLFKPKPQLAPTPEPEPTNDGG